MIGTGVPATPVFASNGTTNDGSQSPWTPSVIRPNPMPSSFTSMRGEEVVARREARAGRGERRIREAVERTGERRVREVDRA